ncbi:hypothetical protein [Ornithinimicrobium sp. INDO-MA30-4]|uniref:hypothetical protein n=1 Tax=Ornithinimicrobium sp. INDO-MA30-4 TaxID=2908651 RepID=UPI001F47BDA3|nr:hypothetical protein [Ornithinimicrobium sp. INDO-MA30-4]UJH71327.1 hypothetical protein L0A91_06075 [Ornithinimicrobium sp. INDO-MA30-4]
MIGLSLLGLTRGAEPSQANQSLPSADPVQIAAAESAPARVLPVRDGELRQHIQELVDARALAWNELDIDALAAATAGGSPAFRADAAALSQARASGLTYEGIGFDVGEIQDLMAISQPWVIGSDKGTGPLVLEVQVPIETSSYDVVTADLKEASAATREPASTQVINLRLLNSDETWRLVQWELTN